MELKIKIDGKYFFLLGVLMILLGGVLFVKAQITGIPNPGHDASNVMVTIGTQTYTLQQAINSDLFTANIVSALQGNCPVGQKLVGLNSNLQYICEVDKSVVLCATTCGGNYPNTIATISDSDDISGTVYGPNCDTQQPLVPVFAGGGANLVRVCSSAAP